VAFVIFSIFWNVLSPLVGINLQSGWERRPGWITFGLKSRVAGKTNAFIIVFMVNSVFNQVFRPTRFLEPLAPGWLWRHCPSGLLLADLFSANGHVLYETPNAEPVRRYPL